MIHTSYPTMEVTLVKCNLETKMFRSFSTIFVLMKIPVILLEPGATLIVLR